MFWIDKFSDDRGEVIMTKSMGLCLFMTLAMVCSLALAAEQGKIKDAESATHGDDAAKHQIVD